MSDKVLCLDIGASSIKSGLVDKAGQITSEKITYLNGGYDNFLDSIGKILSGLEETPEGISLALPGGYDKKEDKIFAPNLTILNGRNIKTDIENRFSLKVMAENDANLAGYGEYVFVEKKAVKNMVFCTLGSGFGGGLILNGSLFQSDMTLFEIGHMSINFNGAECGCGRKGCLDEYCSSSGIVRAYKELTGDEKSVKEISELAKTGDINAEKTFKIFAYNLAGAFANLTALFCPEKIKFGGGLSELSDYYYNDCINEYNKIVFPAYRGRVKIEQAELKNKAGMLGAAALFFNL